MSVSIARSGLTTKSGAELAAIYNELAQKKGLALVDRFPDKSVGVRRIVRLLSEHSDLQVTPAPKQAVCRPFNLLSSKTKRPHRPSCGRGKLISALRTGDRSFEQLLKEFPQWDADRLTHTIRKLSLWLGYGIKEAEDGKIRLFD